jgi:hypothetical protein
MYHNTNPQSEKCSYSSRIPKPGIRDEWSDSLSGLLPTEQQASPPQRGPDIISIKNSTVIGNEASLVQSASSYFTDSYTMLITWKKVLLKKLLVAYVVKKCPIFCGTP